MRVVPGGPSGLSVEVSDLLSQAQPERRAKALRVKRKAVDVLAASINALQNGGAVVPHPLYQDETGKRVEWDVSGRCVRPVPIEQVGEGHLMMGRHKPGAKPEAVWQPARSLALLVPCRQCSACLRARASLWGRRAVSEYQTWPRTWFGTLTFRPEERYRLVATTRHRLDAANVKLETLSPQEQFREIQRDAGPHVTRYLMRLRKGNDQAGFDPLTFRYLLTVEPHQDWFPHYHILVHEVDELKPVRKKVLAGQWPSGFTQWKLVEDERAAFYAAKYLGKYSFARVRASKEYGECVNHTVEDRTTF